ncbi:hypothetical protein VNI00_005243 [Paramarasmius palmivorus]|uniref:Uncharacterized protein n=1 Tax=Paramarasmius palmivorus TaxID=297713 RepID=A0AAW0DBD7_9AGAR
MAFPGLTQSTTWEGCPSEWFIDLAESFSAHWSPHRLEEIQKFLVRTVRHYRRPRPFHELLVITVDLGDQTRMIRLERFRNDTLPSFTLEKFLGVGNLDTMTIDTHVESLSLSQEALDSYQLIEQINFQVANPRVNVLDVASLATALTLFDKDFGMTRYMSMWYTTSFMQVLRALHHESISESVQGPAFGDRGKHQVSEESSRSIANRGAISAGLKNERMGPEMLEAIPNSFSARWNALGSVTRRELEEKAILRIRLLAQVCVDYLQAELQRRSEGAKARALGAMELMSEAKREVIACASVAH